MKFFRFLTRAVMPLLLVATLSTTVSCSKDSDPDNGEVIKPDESIADPTGTIELSMRNDDGTSLNGLYIGSDDNFHGNGWKIASLGQMKGLGNVYTIPATGWTDKISVKPGNGYVAYNSYQDEYYRIYVTDYITGATSGGVIGADIKYQKPFRGLDEEIGVRESQIVLPADGGSQEIVFTNTSIIPFKVSSSEEWCHIQKASTREEAFLSDAIVVSCDETYSATEATAIVTIETLFGKKTEINVTRASRGEFITLANTQYQFPFNYQPSTGIVGVYTNIVPDDITVTCSADWLNAHISDSLYKPSRIVRWIGTDPATRATLENPVSRQLLINVEGYGANSPREAIITLSYGNTKSELTVIQQGTEFYLSKSEFVFDAEDNLTQVSDYSGNLYYDDLSVEYEPGVTWIHVSFDYRQMKIDVDPNLIEEERESVFSIIYKGLPVTEVKVKQKASEISDKYVYFSSTASNYSIAFHIPENAKITSTDQWCTATPNGNNLVIRVTAATEDRCAVITVEGINSKIYVSQSKYKVGDKYMVGDIEGEVYRMSDGVGKIIKELPQLYAWSSENINIIGADDYNDGKINTETIKSIPGWQELYPAFGAVETLNIDGENGWYLPAYNEIKGKYVDYNTYYVWSSTQKSSTEAIRSDGYSVNKNYSYAVIAMKEFSYDFSKQK